MDIKEGVGHTLNRDFLTLQIGEFVLHGKSIYRISEVISLHSVVGHDIKLGTPKLLPVSELSKPRKSDTKGSYADQDLSHIASADWLEAERRFAVIHPLLNGDRFFKGAVAKRAKECGVGVSTIYRWLDAYTEGEQFLSLMPNARGWKTGNSRISPEVEQIIKNTIQTVYMTTARYSMTRVHAAVSEACKLQGLNPPSLPTVKARIKMVPRKKRYLARGMSEAAVNLFEAKPNRYEADFPLQRIQIDHSPADVMIVDDVHRISIGRPWVTMAIDMYSRMVVGYYISLDAPSAISVAMCLVQSMLPKQEWLNHHEIDGEWPVWGKPLEMHTDNGADFKKQSLIESLTIHKIDKQFRPKTKPWWGGHIEALMEENAKEFSHLPGATQRKPKDLGDLTPEKNAVMSFAGLESWLIATILLYNHEPHSGIGFKPPISMWNEAFFGSKTHAPICGLPPIPQDPLTLQIDFFPSTHRTVQTYGVEWGAFYYAEVLRPWINHEDPKTSKKTKLTFRRDTRDINYIWFFEPNEKKYYRIPITYGFLEGVSVSEYVSAKKEVKKNNLGLVNHEAIRALIEQRRRIEAGESEKTKAARKNRQKSANNLKNSTPAEIYTGSVKKHSDSPKKIIHVIEENWGGDDVELYGGVS